MKNSISVNMTPNPLDYQILHCSQNDTTLRKFKFTLHNQGEAVETSSISDPVFSSFTEYEGGTEELLPTNTSTPSTSPILADIQYSDGLREDQSFTYRESPVTKDGKAKVNVLKGNTLVWNQLVENGNFASKSVWVENGVTYSVSNNEASFTVSQSSKGINQVLAGVNGHKYLWWIDINTTDMALIGSANLGARYMVADGFNSYQRITQIATANQDEITFIVYSATANATTIKVKNICVVDLTKMFGAGNEPTTVDEFTSIFPLPYYQYDSGSMLDFKGTGIKTVGFNQWDEEWEQGAISTSTGANSASTARIRSKNYIRIIPTETYYCKAPNNVYVFFYDADYNYLGYSSSSKKNTTFTIDYSNAMYMRFRLDNDGADYENDICINISSSENGKYEPYTTSTTSLPTLTYFPTGMKSAGNVYDELTSNKAVTRVGQVDLGTLDWTYGSSRFQSTGLNGLIATFATNESPNIKCAKYPTFTANATSQTTFGITAFESGETMYLRVLDSNYTSASAFTTAMSGVMLNYELATPSEQSITSASLVTINGESDLYKDGEDLVCDCNEDISKESGYFDAKLRFTDADGTNYSNKFELHVERSPQ